MSYLKGVKVGGGRRRRRSGGGTRRQSAACVGQTTMAGLGLLVTTRIFTWAMRVSRIGPLESEAAQRSRIDRRTVSRILLYHSPCCQPLDDVVRAASGLVQAAIGKGSAPFCSLCHPILLASQTSSSPSPPDHPSTLNSPPRPRFLSLRRSAVQFVLVTASRSRGMLAVCRP